MKQALLKASAKKNKFIKRKKIQYAEEDSDEYMSSDDEELYSQDILGRLIDNKYLILKFLGRGAFCKVWLVLNMLENKYYALKVQEYKYNEDLEMEYNILKHLQKGIKEEEYDNYNFGMCKDMISIKIDNTICKCLVLELLGLSISDIIDNNKENTELKSLSNIKNIFLQIVKGLKYIHEKNVLHTDLKLDNILLTNMSPKIQKFIDEIEELELIKNYNSIYENSIPKEIIQLPKNKRKMIKRKIRNKSLKEVVKSNLDKIKEISGKFIEEFNLQLNIEDIDDSDDNESDDEYQNVECDNYIDENINIKIIDFGNAKMKNNIEEEEIYTRIYRPPENILDNTYDKESDIWVLGCFLYELITLNPLFEIECEDNNDFGRDKEHLSKMSLILGKLPKDMILNSEYSDDIFDSHGKIRNNKKLGLMIDRDLRKELLYRIKKDRIKIEDNDIDLIEDLIYKMLEYKPDKRIKLDDILKHKLFN
jgi:serine/threonine protein kinase